MQQPVFILEGKAPVESRRGGGGGSPASLHLTQEQSSAPWQSESLLAESWSSMGDVDPEDAKSIDSSDGVVLTGEENHSSNSDMVHLEREEAEERRKKEEDEDEELQAGELSMLQTLEAEKVLVSVEEPHVEKEPSEFRHVVPPMALPPLPVVKLDPPSTTSTPVPSATNSEVEELHPTQGLHPPSILVPTAAEPPQQRLDKPGFSNVLLLEAEERSVKTASPTVQGSAAKTKSLSSSELLLGSAALVAVVGVVAYGAMVYCKK